MGKKLLNISDLHFGSGQDLLAYKPFIERIEPELEWADELLINGDLWELALGSLDTAVTRSQPFFEAVAKRISKVILVLGNHDHHLVAASADHRRIDSVTGRPDKHPFHVVTAEKLLHYLIPDVPAFAGYPATVHQDNYFIHGHYLDYHLDKLGIGWKLWESLQWKISGSDRKNTSLAVSDYEALILPLYELLYSTAQLPDGKRTKMQSERLLAFAGAVLSAPGRATKQAMKVEQAMISRIRKRPEGYDERALIEAPTDVTLRSVVEAMKMVCENLAVSPGKVIFGHTHHQFADPSWDDSPWEFYNSGSWTMSDHEIKNPQSRKHSWPGAVLRIEDGEVEIRNTLTGLSAAEIARMSGRGDLV